VTTPRVSTKKTGQRREEEERLRPSYYPWTRMRRSSVPLRDTHRARWRTDGPMPCCWRSVVLRLQRLALARGRERADEANGLIMTAIRAPAPAVAGWRAARPLARTPAWSARCTLSSWTSPPADRVPSCARSLVLTAAHRRPGSSPCAQLLPAVPQPCSAVPGPRLFGPSRSREGWRPCRRPVAGGRVLASWPPSLLACRPHSSAPASRIEILAVSAETSLTAQGARGVGFCGTCPRGLVPASVE